MRPSTRGIHSGGTRYQRRDCGSFGAVDHEPDGSSVGAVGEVDPRGKSVQGEQLPGSWDCSGIAVVLWGDHFQPRSPSTIAPAKTRIMKNTSETNTLIPSIVIQPITSPRIGVPLPAEGFT